MDRTSSLGGSASGDVGGEQENGSRDGLRESGDNTGSVVDRGCVWEREKDSVETVRSKGGRTTEDGPTDTDSLMLNSSDAGASGATEAAGTLDWWDTGSVCGTATTVGPEVVGALDVTGSVERGSDVDEVLSIGCVERSTVGGFVRDGLADAASTGGTNIERS